MNDITLYNRASKGGLKVWRCFVDGTTLVTQWGLEGAKQQETRDPAKPRGKEGTKAYKGPDVVVLEEFERKVKKKKDEGYTEKKDEVRDDVRAFSTRQTAPSLEATRRFGNQFTHRMNDFDFDDPPREFAPAKPINDGDVAALTRLDAAGKLIAQRKRDGMRHFIFFGPTRIQIFSRRMENACGQFKALIEQLEPWREALAGTVLDAEFIVEDASGKDVFPLVASICRAGDLKAQERLRLSKHWHFMVFNILYLKGEPVFSKPYRERHGLASAITLNIETGFVFGSLKVDDAGNMTVDLPPVRMVDNLEGSLADAIDMVKDNGWEGLVVWEADKGTIVQLNGKAKRVNCTKVVPKKEGDFVATGYELGDGRNSDKVGALFISQYHNGQLITVGKVGTGFEEADRIEALTWAPIHTIQGGRVHQFARPQVVKVEYRERTAPDKDSPIGSLRFPVFVRHRTDKAPEECVYVEKIQAED